MALYKFYFNFNLTLTFNHLFTLRPIRGNSVIKIDIAIKTAWLVQKNSCITSELIEKGMHDNNGTLYRSIINNNTRVRWISPVIWDLGNIVTFHRVDLTKIRIWRSLVSRLKPRSRTTSTSRIRVPTCCPRSASLQHEHHHCMLSPRQVDTAY